MSFEASKRYISKIATVSISQRRKQYYWPKAKSRYDIRLFFTVFHEIQHERKMNFQELENKV